MIDPNDTNTLPSLEPVKRRRGRPKTGKAMTAAEKQKAYRDRQRRQALMANLDSMEIEVLNERIEALEKACQELVEIKQTNDARIKDLYRQIEHKQKMHEACEKERAEWKGKYYALEEKKITEGNISNVTDNDGMIYYVQYKTEIHKKWNRGTTRGMTRSDAIKSAESAKKHARPGEQYRVYGIREEIIK